MIFTDRRNESSKIMGQGYKSKEDKDGDILIYLDTGYTIKLNNYEVGLIKEPTEESTE